MDMLQAVQKIESEEWTPQKFDKVDLQKRFGFCLSPLEIARQKQQTHKKSHLV